MSERASERRSRVGVRELRQNLSVYLARVKAGERLEVTEHGRPVASLEPLAVPSRTGLDRIEAEGHLHRAAADPRTLERPPRIPGEPLSEILRAMRDAEDR